MRRGLGVGNALELAVGCDLDEILARPEIDDDVLAGARDIVETLAVGADAPLRLTDYPYAGPAVVALLQRISERPRTPAELRAVAEIQRALTAPDGDALADGAEDRLEACGLDEARLAQALALCAQLLP